jgi:TonB family protein
LRRSSPLLLEDTPMSVGDLHEVERTGESAVALTRIRPRQLVDPAPAERANAGDSGDIAITVLTMDASLADAIYDAAASAHPVATATTPDEALDLAAHGRCDIIITDQISTQPVLRRMTQRLREVQPAVVVIAVGGTGDQNALIGLLSAGIVDRLMLKPIMPTLAQIVLKSAAQQHRTLLSSGTAATLMEQPEPEPSPAEIVVPAPTIAPVKSSRRRRSHIDLRRPHWIAAAAAALLAVLAGIGLIWWMTADHKPAIDVQAVIASNLASGQRAFHEGHEIEPRGRSALDYYNTVLALDPANAAARQGIDQIADRFAAQAGVAIAGGQVAAAIVAVDSIRHIRPDHRQLRELQAQLDAAQEKHVAEHVEPAAQPPAKTAPAKLSVLSSTLQQNVIQARSRAVAQASEALKRDQLELASALLAEARTLGVPAAELTDLNQALASAQQRREQEELQLLAKAEKSFDEASRLLSESDETAPSETSPSAAPAESAGANLPAPSEPAATAAPAPRLKLARMVKPDYPQDALINGTEGWVNVSMSITPDGNVVEPRVVASSNSMLFDRAAISAVRRWKYEPFAASEAQPATVRVDFRIKGRR